MIFSYAHLVEALIVCIAAGACFVLLHRLLGRKVLIGFTAIILWCGIFSAFLTERINPLYESVTVTAIGTQNELSEANQIHIRGMSIGQENIGLEYPISGNWVWAPEESLCGWLTGDNRQPENATAAVVFKIPIGKDRQLHFAAYPWCGYAQVEIEGEIQTIDTYAETAEMLYVNLPDSSSAVVQQSHWMQFPTFIAIFLFCTLTIFGAALIIVKQNKKKKLERYQFLFNELVKRDFSLKYKRTVLGIFWSILSPLLNLLIMWLVFNKIFGSNVNHFIIYLFAGQLIFSYFSDATNQGMTSLLENSGIFTKVNVPKYMFLLSKNVSSLINFSLTLIIFFIFVAFEGLPFTWQYLMLVYPIGCLVLFNIGLGLILSALFVFFRDMQYLWGIFTQLIMWLSAIFYSIESYPQIGQYLFLLNPIYLFIRYFRKIVIDGTIPTIWFHLLMAGYTIVVLLVGCWIYKKNNHEFLYYV